MIIDSNIIIYSALPQYISISYFIDDHKPYCSKISYVEVLGYHKLTEADKLYFEGLFNQFHLIDVEEEIILLATSLRQKINIAACDAIIAATALHYKLDLVTNNEKDFEKIVG